MGQYQNFYTLIHLTVLNTTLYQFMFKKCTSKVLVCYPDKYQRNLLPAGVRFRVYCRLQKISTKFAEALAGFLTIYLYEKGKYNKQILQ